MVEKRPACPSSRPHLRMNTGSIGPTIVVAIPLKMKPTKRTASRPVLVLRSGVDTIVVADMLRNILKEQAAGGNFGVKRGSYVAKGNSCTLFGEL